MISPVEQRVSTTLHLRIRPRVRLAQSNVTRFLFVEQRYRKTIGFKSVETHGMKGKVLRAVSRCVEAKNSKAWQRRALANHGRDVGRGAFQLKSYYLIVIPTSVHMI